MYMCVDMYVHAGWTCPCTAQSELAFLGVGLESVLENENSLARATRNFPQDIANWMKGIFGFALWEKSQHQRKAQAHM